MRNTGFNKIIGFTAVILGTMVVLASGAEAAGKCSLATLKGYYVFNSYGNVHGEEYSDSGHEYFDGKGGVAGHAVDKNGVVQNIAGTYTVDKECEGVISYTQPEASTETIFLGPKGDVFTYIQAGDGDVISGTETRQGK
ncbi:MAG: hypothetical protein RLZZ09_1743 [Pseudomonadota bacterium]|jgi:hypothetical protein